jgi:hypothetical protein
VPFLRVIRDKRGYETTYLMHWFRDGNRQRSRILYAFRTPGGVRVGRDSMDPAVLREIEAHHPDIAFEWKAIRDNLQIIEPAVEQRRRRPRGEEAPPAAVQPTAPRVATPGATPEAAPGAPLEAPPETAPGTAPEAAHVAAHIAAVPSAVSAPVEAIERPKPVPSTIAGETPDEQIAFLTEWYAVIRERIEKRISDPVRRVALHALAERLNPSAWTDADQTTTGLQQAGEALERLSHVFARRRRRGRRRPTEPATPPPSSEPS